MVNVLIYQIVFPSDKIYQFKQNFQIKTIFNEDNQFYYTDNGQKYSKKLFDKQVHKEFYRYRCYFSEAQMIKLYAVVISNELKINFMKIKLKTVVKNNYIELLKQHLNKINETIKKIK